MSRVGVPCGPGFYWFEGFEPAARTKHTASIPGGTRSESGFGGRISSRSQGACERAYHRGQSPDQSLQKADCGTRHKEPSAFYVLSKRLGRGWWTPVLFRRRCRELQTRRTLRGQDSQRHQARGSTRRAADEVRAGDQSQDRQADRPDDSAERVGAGGQSNTVRSEW